MPAHWHKAARSNQWFWVDDAGRVRNSPCVAYWRGYYEVWESKTGVIVADDVEVFSRHMSLAVAQDAALERIKSLDAPPPPKQGSLF